MIERALIRFMAKKNSSTCIELHKTAVSNMVRQAGLHLKKLQEISFSTRGHIPHLFLHTSRTSSLQEKFATEEGTIWSHRCPYWIN